MAKVEVLPNGCWHWTSDKHRKGYGYCHVDKRRIYAHRWAYEYFVGPIPTGLTIDHTCHNADDSCPGGDTCLHRSCVNPDHLEATTMRTNLLRGKGVAAMHAKKQFCKHGHRLTEDNVRRTKSGGRACRTCCYLKHRAWVEANRERVLAVRHRWLADPANRERVHVIEERSRERKREKLRSQA